MMDDTSRLQGLARDLDGSFEHLVRTYQNRLYTLGPLWGKPRVICCGELRHPREGRERRCHRRVVLPRCCAQVSCCWRPASPLNRQLRRVPLRRPPRRLRPSRPPRPLPPARLSRQARPRLPVRPRVQPPLPSPPPRQARPPARSRVPAASLPPPALPRLAARISPRPRAPRSCASAWSPTWARSTTRASTSPPG